MMSKWQWLWAQLTRTLWLRASLFAIFAIIVALLATLAQWILPSEWEYGIGADAVDRILNILASSMLAVTTFSLSVMVSAYGAATSNVTPRATRLLMQDTTTQNVLATFIGSFLFSLVGLIALSTNAYSDAGRFVLFIVTIAVVVLIVITILRWISHLSNFGRVGDSSRRVEEAAARALNARIKSPCLGGRPLTDAVTIPDSAEPVYAEQVAYIQHIDIAGLADKADDYQAQVFLLVLPGDFVHPKRVIGYVDLPHPQPGIDADNVDSPEYRQQALDELRDKLTRSLTLGHFRSFDQDPRFGLSVLAEIASRALSPAVNDPGTAIDILSRAVRVLTPLPDQQAPSHGDDMPYARVWVPMLNSADLLDDVFTPIARDGASLIEVQLRLQKSLLALHQIYHGELRRQVKAQADLAYERARQALTMGDDRTRLKHCMRGYQKTP